MKLIMLTLFLGTTCFATTLQSSCQFTKIFPGSALDQSINLTNNRNSTFDIRSERNFKIQFGSRVFSSQLRDKLQFLMLSRDSDTRSGPQRVIVALTPHESTKVIYRLSLPVQINEMHPVVLFQYLNSSLSVVASENCVTTKFQL